MLKKEKSLRPANRKHEAAKTVIREFRELTLFPLLVGEATDKPGVLECAGMTTFSKSRHVTALQVVASTLDSQHDLSDGAG